MKIFLDGQAYTVPREQEARMIQQFRAKVDETYEKTEPTGQLVITAVVRWILAKMESAVRKSHGKEAALLIRPPKKKEPALHLSGLLANHLQDLVQDAELTIETDGNGNTTAFNFSVKAEDQGGGPLVSHGDQREWQNDGAQIS